MITLRFLAVSHVWVESPGSSCYTEVLTEVRTESWYTPAVPRVDDHLRLHARTVKRVGGDANMFTEEQGLVEGTVLKVIWTGDGCADIHFVAPGVDEG